MKLSTKGRYAARAMLDLALNFNKKPVMLKDIARRQDISVRYLENIMAKLVSAGLVHGLRGKNGGFCLIKTPSKITLKDVVCVVEGSVSPVHCIDIPASCARAKTCITYDIWKQLRKAIIDILSSYTLKDMVEMHKKKIGYSKGGMYYI